MKRDASFGAREYVIFETYLQTFNRYLYVIILIARLLELLTRAGEWPWDLCRGIKCTDITDAEIDAELKDAWNGMLRVACQIGESTKEFAIGAR